MTFTQLCNKVFNMAINDYHVKDDVDTVINNPYDRDSIENRLYLKCWIDTVQWHLEDIIRDPHIDPLEALKLKRRIDREAGRKYMKVYKQMKMYNDPSTNPVLYGKNK